jgi:hypothetical protein
MHFRSWANALALSLVVSTLGAAARGADVIPDSRLGTRVAPLLLLGRADVRAELGLSPEQAAAAERAMVALRTKAAELKGKRGSAVQAARNEIDTEQQEWLKRHLSEAQSIRLMQIELQWEGPAALVTRREIAQKLQLTSAQLKDLRHAVESWHRERVPGTYDAAVEARLERATSAALTDTQRELWGALLGPKFQPQLAQSEGHRTK